MHETGLSSTVRAFHVMPGMPPPEGELHDHEYRLDIIVGRAELDDAGMVVDLDVLDRCLVELTGKVRDRNLDEVVGTQTGADAVTVEVFARWAHEQLSEAIGPLPEASMSVRVWESPVAFGGYLAPVADRTSSS